MPSKTPPPKGFEMLRHEEARYPFMLGYAHSLLLEVQRVVDLPPMTARSLEEFQRAYAWMSEQGDDRDV